MIAVNPPLQLKGACHMHKRRMRRATAALLLVLLAAIAMVATLARPATLRAQEGLRYESYDVAIDIAEDGSFAVTTTQTVRFDDAYSTAFAEIPTERVVALRDIRVYEQDTETGARTPLAFSESDEGGVRYVEWEYDESRAGEARTFVLAYTVEGGLWAYDDRDILRWFAINADRSGLPVESANVTVTVPDGAADSLSAEVISGNGVASVTGNQARFQTSGALADGEPLEIEVGFAHGMVQAARQPWQQAIDAANMRIDIPEVAVGVTVQYDGRLDVSEETTVAVEAGVLDQGVRSIALLYMDDIVDVDVLQDGKVLPLGQEGCSNCFVLRPQPGFESWASYEAQSGEVVIDDGGAGRLDIAWYGEPVAAGETTQITIKYGILGGVLVGDDAQVVHLELLPDYDAVISRASFQIMPPPRTAAEALGVESGAAMGPAEVQPDGSVIYRNWDLPAERARWEVVITMPPGATSAVAPRWQAQFEAAVAAQAAAATDAARRTLATRTGVHLRRCGCAGSRCLGLVSLRAQACAGAPQWVCGRPAVGFGAGHCGVPDGPERFRARFAGVVDAIGDGGVD